MTGETIATTFLVVVGAWAVLVFGVGSLINAWINRGSRRRR